MYKYVDRKLVEKILSELLSSKWLSQHLKLLKNYHLETYEHSIRVAKLSIDLALENRLPIKMVRALGQAAILHDFGKLRVDTAILSKKEALSHFELMQVRHHPRLGIFELEKFISNYVKSIIVSHHEFKLHPYPRKNEERRERIRLLVKERRKRNKIVMIAQIVAAADIYDALVFPRSYKPGFEISKAKEIMINQFTGKPLLINQITKRDLKVPLV